MCGGMCTSSRRLKGRDHVQVLQDRNRAKQGRKKVKEASGQTAGQERLPELSKEEKQVLGILKGTYGVVGFGNTKGVLIGKPFFEDAFIYWSEKRGQGRKAEVKVWKQPVNSTKATKMPATEVEAKLFEIIQVARGHIDQFNPAKKEVSKVIAQCKLTSWVGETHAQATAVGKTGVKKEAVEPPKPAFPLTPLETVCLQIARDQLVPLVNDSTVTWPKEYSGVSSEIITLPNPDGGMSYSSGSERRYLCRSSLLAKAHLIVERARKKVKDETDELKNKHTGREIFGFFKWGAVGAVFGGSLFAITQLLVSLPVFPIVSGIACGIIGFCIFLRYFKQSNRESKERLEADLIDLKTRSAESLASELKSCKHPVRDSIV